MGILKQMPADVRHILCTGDALARNGEIEATIKSYEHAAEVYEATNDNVNALAVWMQIIRLVNAHALAAAKVRQIDLRIQKLRERLRREEG